MQRLHVLSPIFHANRQAALHIEGLLADLGVSATEGQLLSYVRLRGAVPVAELIRLLGTPKSTMTSMLHRLARQGLVLRSENPDDRRSFLVSTTERGDQVALEARARVQGFEARLLRHLTRTDLEALQRIVSVFTTETTIDLVAEGSRRR